MKSCVGLANMYMISQGLRPGFQATESGVVYRSYKWTFDQFSKQGLSIAQRVAAEEIEGPVENIRIRAQKSSGRNNGACGLYGRGPAQILYRIMLKSRI